MCQQLAVQSLSAWLASQERMLRAWCDQASLDPGMDEDFLARLEQHCAWMSAQLNTLGAEEGRLQ